MRKLSARTAPVPFPPGPILACLLLAGCFLAAGGIPALAATPPPLVNYQGVLRDASDKPRSGTFDMTFHFFDAVTGGSEILVDAHTGGGGVVVTGGLFNVQLGGGTVSDGAGTGNYTSLPQMFGDYAAVWMEIQVGAETLAPRIRVQAEPYALNASNLEGKNASSFLDTSAGSQTKAGHLAVNNGIDATAGSGFGINASGGQAGGAFGAGGAFAYVADTGVINTGIRAQGNDAGGWFRDNNGSGQAYVAYGDYGIDGSGNSAGGYFHTSTGTGYARLGSGNAGVYGNGSLSGGEFQSADGTSTGYVGYPGYGIYSIGDAGGGSFYPTSGSTQALLGTPSYAVDAFGHTSLGTKAGRFQDTSTGSLVTLGETDYGFIASGLNGGGFNSTTGNSSATIANGSWGLHAVGRFCGSGCGGGGVFQDSNPSGATAYVAYSDVGIETHASGSGGSFYNTNGISTAVATSGGYGLTTNGTKNFVQNHPEDPTAVIAYAALEGDEAGTYTRGMARLIDGEARIPLGETFKWVTNPDIGLTAHLTPVGEWADLYVVSKSTKEIVVRSRDPRATNVAFDYIVFGLREGFEKTPVIREKEHEMPIPADASGESLFAAKPYLERFTALSRFRGMRREVTGDTSLDLSASEELRSKIHVFNAARDGEAFRAPAPPPSISPSPGAGAVPAADRAISPASPSLPAPSPAAADGGIHRAGDSPAAPLFPPGTSPVMVEGSVRAGDVVTVTGAREGEAALAGEAQDRGVLGIIGGELDAAWTGRAPLVQSGVVAFCNADATGGPIAVGDLLVSSSMPGHAARAPETPLPGTVIAKALESLEAGTGTLRLLVLSR